MLVHFTGYNKRYDEWLPQDTERVRAPTEGGRIARIADLDDAFHSRCVGASCGCALQQGIAFVWVCFFGCLRFMNLLSLGLLLFVMGYIVTLVLCYDMPCCCCDGYWCMLCHVLLLL